MIVYQRIRRLVERGHEVSLAAYRSDDDAEHTAAIAPLLRELEIVPAPPLDADEPSFRKEWLSRPPYPFKKYASDAMNQRVGDMVNRSHYDVALAEFAVMGQALHHNPYLPAVRTIVSIHHSLAIVNQKALKVRSPSFQKFRIWLMFNRLKQYEFRLYQTMDRILVLTPEERLGLLKYAPNLPVTVIPVGVDTEYFQPADEKGREQAILFTGHYSEEPNRDAITWFVRAVWPMLGHRYPELKLYIVGPGATPEMKELARKDLRIQITGEVEDVRPYLAKARVYVCPVRMGSGMRGKILEAMAMGTPVVSTSLGAEGIPVQMGDNAFLADTPVIMAQYIDLLLSDQGLRASMTANALEMACTRFSWGHGINLLEKVLRDVTGHV
ncbi:MAG: hypothetical protein A2X46_12205 [Lentisphaerae bacterium GWF2_57_35]|nr:MAG: hypothetical protein A2X46_12205 [Lentisphaerae bacterium GWF2_57_35]